MPCVCIIYARKECYCQARALLPSSVPSTGKGALLFSWSRQVGNFKYLVLWEHFLKDLNFPTYCFLYHVLRSLIPPPQYF